MNDFCFLFFFCWRDCSPNPLINLGSRRSSKTAASVVMSKFSFLLTNFIRTARHFGSLSSDGNVKQFFLLLGTSSAQSCVGSAAYNTTLSHYLDGLRIHMSLDNSKISKEFLIFTYNEFLMLIFEVNMQEVFSYLFLSYKGHSKS